MKESVLPTHCLYSPVMILTATKSIVSDLVWHLLKLISRMSCKPELPKDHKVMTAVGCLEQGRAGDLQRGQEMPDLLSCVKRGS